MKFQLDKKYLHWGITAFCVIACSILFYLLFSRLPAIGAGIRKIFDILEPILFGIIIAYLLAKPVNWMERAFLNKLGQRLFPKSKNRAAVFSRAAAIGICLVVLLGAVAGLLALILPQLGQSIHNLISSMPQYLSASIDWITGLFSHNPTMKQYAVNAVNTVTSSFVDWAQTDLLSAANNILTDISSSAVSIISFLFNVLIGLIAAVYLLFSKETFIAQIKKTVYTVFSVKHANTLIKSMRYTNSVFSRTILGRLLEALIVGVLCFVLMLIFRIPYAGLISVIVGVTDIIPFFGPFIGAVPSAFLILLVDPVKALIFVALIIVLQQIEGNILAPKILGSLVGMPSFWIMFSTLFVGGLFGISGMVFGVPLFAVLLTLVQWLSQKRLTKKGLPYLTVDYMDLTEVDANGVPQYAENAEQGE